MNGARSAVLEVNKLNVRFRTPDGIVHAVRDVDLRVHAGETVAVVGESGSGKSQIMMAIMGLLAENGDATGSVRYRDEEILGIAPRALNAYRGVRLGMIFQEPMTSLDPLYTIGRQIAEPLSYHRGVGTAKARERVLELLRLVHLGEPERRLRSYPHELSGGQRQRVMIAMALANDPDVLIADEPTTALDVTIQAEILSLLEELQARLRMAVVFISHDLGVVRRIADRVYVMREGRVVESGESAQIFANPKHPYTKMLLAAEPEGRKQPAPDGAPILLEGNALTVTFKLSERGLFRAKKTTLVALDNVSLALHEGQTTGVVGESGSGKSTLARALLMLLPCEGAIRFDGRRIDDTKTHGLRAMRRELQIVFQDPFGSLSPRLTAGEIVTEGLLVHEPGLARAERERAAIEVLRSVELDPALRNRYPHEFSGGQRQRIAIARVLVLKPRVVVLDEPTSALDRSVQKQIINLLRALQEEYHMSYLFISHDLAVVRALADHIVVMQAGKIVEQGATEMIFGAPKEAYTRRLISAALE